MKDWLKFKDVARGQVIIGRNKVFVEDASLMVRAFVDGLDFPYCVVDFDVPMKVLQKAEENEMVSFKLEGSQCVMTVGEVRVSFPVVEFLSDGIVEEKLKLLEEGDVLLVDESGAIFEMLKRIVNVEIVGMGSFPFSGLLFVDGVMFLMTTGIMILYGKFEKDLGVCAAFVLKDIERAISVLGAVDRVVVTPKFLRFESAGDVVVANSFSSAISVKDMVSEIEGEERRIMLLPEFIRQKVADICSVATDTDDVAVVVKEGKMEMRIFTDRAVIEGGWDNLSCESEWSGVLKAGIVKRLLNVGREWFGRDGKLVVKDNGIQVVVSTIDVGHSWVEVPEEKNLEGEEV